MYEFLDVYVFSTVGNPDLKVELTHNNWNDVQFSGNTGTAEDGIVNFKLRAYDAFGLRIYPASQKTNITIAVSASEPSMTYLTSPFRKATKSEIKDYENTESNSLSEAGTPRESNTVLYVIIGIGALIISLLVGILLGRRRSAVLLLTLLCSISSAYAQQDGGMTWHDTDSYQEWLEYQRRMREQGGIYTAADWRDGFRRADKFYGKLNDNLGKAVNLYEVANSLYKAHKNLGACMRSTPPPGMPSVPSFCETSDCERCFVDARNVLNTNRYNLEKLKTIYDCTKNYIDLAIAFGNSFSSLPGGGGMAWGFERIKLEKSLNKLRGTYDNKYQELMEIQQQLLMDLNECENQHGIIDWYDRFGYMIYEFNAMYYKRSS
jgi:hypothetical protein